MSKNLEISSDRVRSSSLQQQQPCKCHVHPTRIWLSLFSLRPCPCKMVLVQEARHPRSLDFANERKAMLLRDEGHTCQAAQHLAKKEGQKLHICRFFVEHSIGIATHNAPTQQSQCDIHTDTVTQAQVAAPVHQHHAISRAMSTTKFMTLKSTSSQSLQLTRDLTPMH